MPENHANAAEAPFQLRHAFVRQTSPFNCVAYSPDGKYLASGSYDRTVRVWEAESGKLLRTLEGHSSTVMSMSYSPDGKYLASGSESTRDAREKTAARGSLGRCGGEAVGRSGTRFTRSSSDLGTHAPSRAGRSQHDYRLQIIVWLLLAREGACVPRGPSDLCTSLN